MHDRITGFEIANEARLMRTNFKGAIIITEGDTDVRVYRRVVGGAPRFVPAKGKPNALLALRILEIAGFSGFLVIVDADFWRLDGMPLSSANLVITDCHDLESMILASAALDAVLGEFGSPEKINNLPRKVREILLDCGKHIGFLKWLCTSSRYNLKVSLNDIDIRDFVDKRTLVFNRESFIKEVWAKSKECVMNVDELTSKLSLLETTSPDLWQVCSGHDLVIVLVMGLRFLFGNSKGRGAKIDSIEAALRLAYTIKDFSLTTMWTAIGEWEKANPLLPVRS